mmetsp:Transcript_14032/g.30470  ORF Transcript_14032/g.30470 Transcript_14032/m.30470 type:complete len:313 (+) Transcript_14032:104-1042(+)
MGASHCLEAHNSFWDDDVVENMPDDNSFSRFGKTPRRVPVFLNVYDLGTKPRTQVLNQILRMMGSGAFHTGVQVYGREWSYRGAMRHGTGVFCCAPQGCDSHTFRESVFMGDTFLSERQVVIIIHQLEAQWLANQYSLLRQNCCHFCDALCNQLGVGEIPQKVKNLAQTGAAFEEKVTRMSNRFSGGSATISGGNSAPSTATPSTSAFAGLLPNAFTAAPGSSEPTALRHHLQSVESFYAPARPLQHSSSFPSLWPSQQQEAPRQPPPREAPQLVRSSSFQGPAPEVGTKFLVPASSVILPSSHGPLTSWWG